MWTLISVSLALLSYFFKDYWINYWQSIIDTLTDIRSIAYTRFFLQIFKLLFFKISDTFFKISDTINNILYSLFSVNMTDIKNTLSRFKVNARSKIKNKTTNIKNGFQKFKENFSEAKSKPRSKRRCLLLGFSTVVSIFGVTLFTSILPAVAKDIPNGAPKPGQVCPAAPTLQPTLITSQQIITGLSGVAATICALAVSSGPFVIGGICGLVVVVGVLKAQGK